MAAANTSLNRASSSACRACATRSVACWNRSKFETYSDRLLVLRLYGCVNGMIPRFKSMELPNNSSAGATPVPSVGVELMILNTNGNASDQSLRTSLSKMVARRCRKIYLLARSTMALPSCECGMVRWCSTPVIANNCSQISFTNWDPLSEVSCSGSPYRAK